MRRRPVSVIEFPGYERRAGELLTADEQTAIVDLIAYDPTCGDVIPGTGGVRKLRVALAGGGKRGGARVIYYFYNENHPALLLTLYAKNEKADLRGTEKRIIIGLVTEIVEQWRRK